MNPINRRINRPPTLFKISVSLAGLRSTQCSRKEQKPISKALPLCKESPSGMEMPGTISEMHCREYLPRAFFFSFLYLAGRLLCLRKHEVRRIQIKARMRVDFNPAERSPIDWAHKERCIH